MSFDPIAKIGGIAPVTTGSNWLSKYKEAFVEHQHDYSQLSLVLPDDCLVVMGPPRLAHASGEGAFHPVGFLNTITYSETRQVQPLKGIGSRRHIFAATNAPVQGSIARLLFLGRNLYKAFYANAKFGAGITDRNSKFAGENGDAGLWYANAEEDIFRVPFGLGIIYNSPASLASSSVMAGAEYLEVCTIVNKNVSVTSGQAMIMEQVSFQADRVLPWGEYSTPSENEVSDIIGYRGLLG